jgi:hypothetical protein
MSLLVVTITTTGAAAATAKDRRDALRNAFAYIAGLWDKLFKMKRFEYGARRRYKLLPRSGEPGSGKAFRGSYTEAKLKRRKNGAGIQAIGETKAFVWSGDSRNKARQQRNIVAKAASHTRAYAENIFNIPTLNLRPEGGQIHLRDEFQIVIEEERKLLEGLGAMHYENNVNRAPPQTTRVA